MRALMLLRAASLALALAGCARETPITASQLPPIRAGEWAFTGTTGQTTTRGATCLTSVADTLGRSYAGCTGFRYSREAGGALVVRNRCIHHDGAVVKTRVRLAGDFTSRIRFEDDIRITLPGGRPLHPVVRIDYRYRGPCPN